MKLLVCLALIEVALAAFNPKCAVGDWDDWSECKTSSGCSTTDGESWDAEPALWDTGRIKMKKIMQAKIKRWNERKECMAAGTCPHLTRRAPEGRMNCDGGYSDLNECRNIDRLSFVSFTDLVGNSDGADMNGNDIWGWTDPENGDEYAIMCLTGGTSFVRVTDPENPVVVGFLYTQTVASLWRDAKVIGNFVYIVSEAKDHGLQIFDLTQLRGRKTIKYFQPTRNYERFGNAHNIVANEKSGFVYVVGATRGAQYDLCSGGLHMVDVRDPLNPTFAGCFGGDGYVHDAQCVYYTGPDLRYHGREICLSFNEDTFTIVDVHDKNDVKILARKAYTGVSYSHQGWFTEDQRLVFLDDELDEYNDLLDQRTRTYIWDVTDLENPTLRRTYYSSVTAIDHNLYTRDNLLYQSNYEAGLRILNIDQDNYNINEVAYFDVFPASNTANFDGSWSSYPYFGSRNIVVSGIDSGLWILRPDYAAISKAAEEKTVFAEQRRVRRLLSGKDDLTCPVVGEMRQCKANVTC